MRIKFNKGKQKRFIDEVAGKIGSPSIRSLRERGLGVNYQTLKSYYSEKRTLPETLFMELCKLAVLKPDDFQPKRVDEHWGQAKGGSKPRLKSPRKK